MGPCLPDERHLCLLLPPAPFTRQMEFHFQETHVLPDRWAFADAVASTRNTLPLLSSDQARLILLVLAHLSFPLYPHPARLPFTQPLFSPANLVSSLVSGNSNITLYLLVFLTVFPARGRDPLTSQDLA